MNTQKTGTKAMTGSRVQVPNWNIFSLSGYWRRCSNSLSGLVLCFESSLWPIEHVSLLETNISVSWYKDPEGQKFP